MALLTKPNMQQVWASGGDIVEPSDLKKQQGWTVEVPPHQFENWIQNRQDEYLAHINQRGIPAWDGLTNYEAGGLSYVQGSDGKVYKSVVASGPTTVVSNPTTDLTDTYWTEAFASIGAFLTQTAGDARYAQRANNLSDVTNAATAFANIKQPASETATGVVELATAAEAQAFAADKFIDGAKLAEAFKGANYSLGANGYQKLPSGLIIQWGLYTGNLDDQPAATITLPIAYTTAHLSVVCSPSGAVSSTGSNFVSSAIGSKSLTNFQLLGYGVIATATGYHWVSIGI